MAADWHQFAGHCYKNLDGKKSWHDARTACTNEAAQLVMLKNQTYIDAFKQMQHCFDYSAGTWLGLSDVVGYVFHIRSVYIYMYLYIYM